MPFKLCPYCRQLFDEKTEELLEDLERAKAECLGLRIINRELNERIERLELVLFRVGR